MGLVAGVVVRRFQSYVDPEEPAPVGEEEGVALPLGDTTLTCNLGVPIIVVCCKVLCCKVLWFRLGSPNSLLPSLFSLFLSQTHPLSLSTYSYFPLTLHTPLPTPPSIPPFFPSPFLFSRTQWQSWKRPMATERSTLTSFNKLSENSAWTVSFKHSYNVCIKGYMYLRFTPEMKRNRE